jgi:hypothetical protein
MHLNSQILSFRISDACLFAAACLLAMATMLCGECCAQNPFGDDNPFGNGGQGDRDQTITLSSDAAPPLYETSSDLVARSVAQSNPTSAAELAKAVSIMVDLSRFDEAKNYLTQLASIELDGEASYLLNNTVGPDFFYMVARTDELQPEGRVFVKKVYAAANAWANSESRIKSLVAELAKENIMQRSEAFAKLRRIGEPAVAEILETFADESRSEEFPGLRGALYNFGESAVAPLAGAAESENETVQLEAIRGLARQDSKEAMDVLVRAWLSPKMPPSTKAIAQNRMLQSNVTPDRVEIENRLADRVERFLDGARISSDSLLGEVTFWDWNDETSSLERTRLASSLAARVRARKLARTLYEINPTSNRNRELSLLTQLESDKRTVGPSSSIDVDAFIESNDSVSPEEMERLLDRCIELDLIPAATACCEVLKKIGTISQISGQNRKPLIKAILTGDRHLQFAALDATIEIDPQASFPGSSYVSELAAFIASSRFRKGSAVGHIRNDLASAYSSILNADGFGSSATFSSRGLFEKVTSDPDVDLILVSDTLHHPNYQSLIQQIRSHWKTRRTPIGLLASDADRLMKASRNMEYTDRLLTFPYSKQQDAIVSQAKQLEALHSDWNISNDDRYRHAARAVAWLDKLATDPKYRFYNLRAHQDRLLGLLYHPEFTPAAARILASQPTRRAQRALVGFVSQNELPIEAREAVADAFASAVKRSGTMLTTDEIQLQYERYNASENQPVETQKVLGRVLDVIESRRNSLRQQSNGQQSQRQKTIAR